MSADLSNNLICKLDEIEAQFEHINERLLETEVLSDHRQVRVLSVKRAALQRIVEEYRAYRHARREAADLREAIRDEADPELAEMARSELPALEESCRSLMESVQKRLVTADDRAIGSIIVEIRAGVGGDEAAIWAGDLAEMYQRHANRREWTAAVLHAVSSEQGGFKSIILGIEGEGVWAELGYEGGTHQVKRVPATEAQGRIHTSTATVAVLPEPEDVDIDLDPGDVKEMITTAQGPGGQNVNKVATAVHLIHEPSGVEVRMQETKSQAQNREKAWQLLRARLYERQQREANAKRARARNAMIGSANRAEKIRTYRYRENIVVDHRVGATFNLSRVMAGDLQPLLEALIEQDTAQRLAAM